jgi:hypothetical protein
MFSSSRQGPSDSQALYHGLFVWQQARRDNPFACESNIRTSAGHHRSEFFEYGFRKPSRFKCVRNAFPLKEVVHTKFCKQSL